MVHTRGAGGVLPMLAERCFDAGLGVEEASPAPLPQEAPVGRMLGGAPGELPVEAERALDARALLRPPFLLFCRGTGTGFMPVSRPSDSMEL